MNYPPLKASLKGRIITPTWVFAGYQSKQDFLKDFERKFVISNAYKQIETLYNRVFKTMEDV